MRTRPCYWRLVALAGAFTLGTGLAAPACSQALTERLLGTIELKGGAARGQVISRRGDQIALRERVDGGERYVTLAGPGETFDRLLNSAVWIEKRLVYYAVKGQQTILVDGARRTVLKGTPTSPAVIGRLWPSADHRHYLAFVSDGKSVGWYTDGLLQPTKLDKLALVQIQAPASVPLFAGAKGCDWRLVGHAPSAAARWDLLHWVRTSNDGSAVYVYGTRAGLALLQRNGVTLHQGVIDNFSTSADGKTWMAVADRSANGVDRVELLRNGLVVDSAETDLTRQQLALSADGSTWVWQIIDADYLGASFRQPGKPDRPIDVETLEWYLSGDGKNVAVVQRSKVELGRVEVDVAGQRIGPLADLRRRSFQFGAGSTFSFVRFDGKQRAVVSHLGDGPAFDDVSEVLMFPDGRPAYVGYRGPQAYAVVGTVELSLPADNVHHVNSLRIEGGSLRVLATRGSSVVDFSVSAN